MGVLEKSKVVLTVGERRRRERKISCEKTAGPETTTVQGHGEEVAVARTHGQLA